MSKKKAGYKKFLKQQEVLKMAIFDREISIEEYEGWLACMDFLFKDENENEFLDEFED